MHEQHSMQSASYQSCVISVKPWKVVLAANSLDGVLVVQGHATSLLVLIQDNVRASLKAAEPRDGDLGIGSRVGLLQVNVGSEGHEDGGQGIRISRRLEDLGRCEVRQSGLQDPSPVCHSDALNRQLLVSSSTAKEIGGVTVRARS